MEDFDYLKNIFGRFDDFNVMNDAFANIYNNNGNSSNNEYSDSANNSQTDTDYQNYNNANNYNNVNDGGASNYRKRKMYENIQKGNFIDVKWTEVEDEVVEKDVENVENKNCEYKGDLK